MINSDIARGATCLHNALLLLPDAERDAGLAILGALDSADRVLHSEPAGGPNPYAAAAGVLVALLDTYHRELRRLA